MSSALFASLDRSGDPLVGLAALSRALRGAAQLADVLEAVVGGAIQLDPGQVRRALVYVRPERAGEDAAADALTLRAAAPRPSAGEDPVGPPAAVLGAVAASSAPQRWTPSPAGPEGAWILLPLGTGPGAGVLALQLAAPLPPAAEPAYRLLAEQCAMAMELILLRCQAARGAAEVGLLDEITRVVGSSLSLDEILTQTLIQLSTLIPFDGGSIALVNGSNELEIRAAYGLVDAAAREVRMPLGVGISGWVAAQGRPYLSNDLDAQGGVRPAMRSTGTNRNIGAYMAAPLVDNGKVTGILQVNSAAKGVFTDHDLALLADVAARCAVAVDRARLFGEMQARAMRLASLTEIARRISAALDLPELFETCYEQVQKVMPADAFLVALYDEAAGEVRYEFLVDDGIRYPQRAEPFGNGLTSYVIRTRQPLSVGAQVELPIAPGLFGSQARLPEALLMVPLVFEDRVLGAMSAQSFTPHAYRSDDLSLLSTIANQAAVAIRNAQLYGSERAAQQAKDEFISLVSHELRTPLTTIKGSAQVMQRRIVKAFSAGLVPTPEDREGRAQELHQLAMIVSQAERLNALVNDLLDLSRLHAGRFQFQPKPADLAVLVRQTVEASLAFSARHRLTVDAPAAVPGIFDAMRIEQVLTNLISNAVKYTPPDTEVQVRVLLPAPGEALVQVCDQGAGLEPADQEHLFERFYRGRAARGNTRTGLGLGLYISKEIVEWHGGRIWVERGPQGGNIFQFTLPLAGPPAAAAPPPPAG